MSLDLASVHAKLARAEEHFYILQNEIRAWMHHNPYRYVTEVSSDFRKHSIIVRQRTTCEAPIRKWSLLVGDTLHNLRSALDHLIYAIAVHQTGANPPPHDRIFSFPIFDSPHQFASFKGRFSSGTLSDNVWTALEDMQPYRRKHPEIPPLLSILSEFDNADKHRFLKVAFATVAYGDIGFAGMQSMHVKAVEIGAFYGELQDGAEVFSYTFDHPSPDMKFDRVELEMVFAVWHGKRDPTDPPWKERTDVGAVIRDITVEVKEVIDLVSRFA